MLTNSPDADVPARPLSPDKIRILGRRELVTRRVVLGVLLGLLHLGAVLAVVNIATHGIHRVSLVQLVVLYFVTGFGVTIGYHRLFTHKSFETSRPVKLALTIVGSMALQGSLLQWVADHRRHHSRSDEVGDPHSPRPIPRTGFWPNVRGLAHGHIGWLFDRERTRVASYVPDLLADRAVFHIGRLYPLWVAVSLILPAVLGAVITRSWAGAWSGFLIAGVGRVVLLYHVTWSVNSICHRFGKRPYATHDDSRNLAPLAVITFGESWHNNHHAAPRSAFHGFRLRQLDPSGLIIRVMEWCHLVWRVQRPARARLLA